MPARVRVAALGYYGFGNLGDEAVLAGIRTTLDEVFPSDFTVLTANATESSRLHPGTGTAERWNLRSMGKTLQGTDLFILGGGSLLQDATSIKSILWYAIAARIARRHSRKVLWWGQGIGPLNSSASRLLTRMIAHQADAITVRDSASATLLKEIGVRGSISIVADPAFALKPATEPDSFQTRPKPETIMALRPWREDAGVISAFSATFGGKKEITGLPMHLPGDQEFMNRIFGTSFYQTDWRSGGMTVERTLGIIACAQLTVAMRLHALIFAARCGIPFLAVSYDQKVNALAHAAGQDDALISVKELTAERLTSALDRVQNTTAKRRERLSNFALAQGELARIPARIAAGLV